MDNKALQKVDPAAQSDVIPQTLNLTKLNNLKQITFIGKMMAQSGMFSDLQRDPAKAIVKIIAGQEMGIPPVEACRGLDIIQGQVAIGAGLMASKIKASDKYDYKVLKWDNEACLIHFFERNPETGKMEFAGPSEFTMADARAAALATKDNWRKWPRNMLFSRAMSNGQSIYAPDIFQVGKVYTPEELDDERPAKTMDANPAMLAETTTPAAEEVPSVEETPDNDQDETGDPVETDAEIEQPAALKKPALVLIGEELQRRGFDNQNDRKAIAFQVADVKKASDMSEDEWQEVLQFISEVDTEELQDTLKEAKQPGPAEKTDSAETDEMPADFLKSEVEVAEVTDEDLANIDQPQAADPQRRNGKCLNLKKAVPRCLRQTSASLPKSFMPNWGWKVTSR
jgi:hypothetical protein